MQFKKRTIDTQYLLLHMYDIIVIGGTSTWFNCCHVMSVVKALNTLIITKDIGGQAVLTNDIENYPAFDHVLIEIHIRKLFVPVVIMFCWIRIHCLIHSTMYRQISLFVAIKVKLS